MALTISIQKAKSIIGIGGNIKNILSKSVNGETILNYKWSVALYAASAVIKSAAWS